MKSIKLLLLKRKADGMYNHKNHIINLIDSHDNVKIQANEIAFKESRNYEFNFDIKQYSTDGDKDISFVINIQTDEDSNDEYKQALTNLVSTILELIIKSNKNIKTTILKNDLSEIYASEAYLSIYRVENKIREFLYILMSRKVGYGWIQSVIPDGINTRSSHQEVDESDFLHEIFFSDLIRILFEGQRKEGFRNIGDIELFVKKAKSNQKDTINIEEIYGVVSSSIWQKYFSDSGLNESAFKSNLERLSKLRNAIAHNKFISFKELNTIKGICNKIVSVIITAEDKIDDIIFTDDDIQLTKDVTEEVTWKFGHYESIALTVYLDLIRADNQIVSSRGGQGQFDAVYLDKMNEKIGVEVRRKVSSHEEADELARKLIEVSKREKIKKIDLVMIEKNLFSNFEEKINMKIRKFDPESNIIIRTVTLKEFPVHLNNK